MVFSGKKAYLLYRDDSGVRERPARSWRKASGIRNYISVGDFEDLPREKSFGEVAS